MKRRTNNTGQIDIRGVDMFGNEKVNYDSRDYRISTPNHSDGDFVVRNKKTRKWYSLSWTLSEILKAFPPDSIFFVFKPSY